MMMTKITLWFLEYTTMVHDLVKFAWFPALCIMSGRVICRVTVAALYPKTHVSNFGPICMSLDCWYRSVLAWYYICTTYHPCHAAHYLVLTIDFFMRDLNDKVAMADTMSANEYNGAADVDEVPALLAMAPPPKSIRPNSHSFQV